MKIINNKINKELKTLKLKFISWRFYIRIIPAVDNFQIADQDKFQADLSPALSRERKRK